MSYRDIRNFTEMMRALGYRRLISVENFRVPNFTLVAEVLQWLVKRYDPNADLPSEIDTEQDRVIFIKSVAQFVATKAHIKLNTKKLYMADGYAVKELLKITSLLYEAMKSKVEVGINSKFEESFANLNFDLSSRLNDLRTTRHLASEITLKGASLYDLLAKEIELREIRTAVLAKQLDIGEIEKGLKNAIKGVEEEILKTKEMIENVASDEANLEAKIEKRKTELERKQKRLQTLKSVRPAFMDEYERLEQELEQLYGKYVIKFHWLAYLEQQLEELEKAEQEQILERDQTIRKMVEKLRQEEMLRSEEGSTLNEFITVEAENEITLGEPREKPRRPQPAGSGVRREGRRVFGSMSGGDKDDSLDTDSDLDLDGEDEDGSDVSDDDQELENLADKKLIPLPHSVPQDSDNDF